MSCQARPLVIVFCSKASGQKEACVGSGRGRDETWIVKVEKTKKRRVREAGVHLSCVFAGKM